MAEGTGLENRHTGNGIEGSNPSLSAMIALLLQSFTPGDCILTGLCALNPPPPGPPSGLLFLLLGVVLAGSWKLLRSTRRSP